MSLSRQLAEALSDLGPRARPVDMTEAKLKKALWAGVILDNPEFLIVWWKRNVGPLHSKISAHHMTVIFKPTPAQMAKLDLGAKVSLRVDGYAADGKGQAVVLSGYRNADANREPHITVATAPGVSPIYSNELIAGGVTPISGPTLIGRVGFHDGKQDRFDFEGTIYESIE